MHDSPAPAVRAASTGRAAVSRDERALRLQWPGGASLEFALDQQRILGIRAVACGSVALRNSRRLWRPLVATPQGISYQSLLLQDVQAGDDGRVTVIAQAVGQAGAPQEEIDEYLGDVLDLSLSDEPVCDRFEWDFTPSKRTIGGMDFAGFSYRYRFSSSDGQRRIYRLFDDATWEIGGGIAGNTLLLQGQCNPPVSELTRESYFTTACNYYGAEMAGVLGIPKRVSFQRLPRIGTLQAFDMLVHEQGVLLGLFEPVEEVLSVIQKAPGEDVLHILDEHRQPLGSTFETNPRHILFAPAPKPWRRCEQRNLWGSIFEQVHEEARRRAGVIRSAVLPRIWIPQYGVDRPKVAGKEVARERALYELADRVLPQWAQMGVKEICTHSLWVSDYTADRLKRKDEVGGMHGALVVGSICNVRVHEIDPLWGGVEAVAYFTEKAHALGIQVQLWWATHMSRRAPIFKERPDFMCMARDGLANGGGFGHDGPITLNLNEPDCRNWIRDKLLAVQKATNVDGVFHDSYGNMTFLPMNYADPLRRGQQQAYAQLLKELQQGGLRTFTIEGIGPWGVGHFGMGLRNRRSKGNWQNALDWWISQEDMIYGLNMGIAAEPWPGQEQQAQEFSFRTLAGGGRFGFTGHEGELEHWDGFVRDHNLMYGQIAPLHGRRQILPDDQGVLWDLGERGRVLFSFRAASFPTGGASTIERIVPAGAQALPVQDTLVTRPWAIYQLR